MNKNRPINLPEKLYKELMLNLQQSSFKSIDDYIAYILQNYLDQQKLDNNNKQQSHDDEAVLKRLEDLGYM
jgi:hypothetical protein